jgi:hypothetical protein
MKAALKSIALGMLASFAMSAAFPTDAFPVTLKSEQSRCFAYPKSVSLQSRLVANEKRQEMSWTTRCTSAFFATVSGSNQMTLRLQGLENGRWVTIDSGQSLSANLGPGAYRVILENEWGMPGLYTFTYRKAIG